MSEGTPPQLSDEEARRKRQAALRALAQTQLGVPAEGPAAKATGTTAPAPTRPGPVAPARTRRRPLPWLLISSTVLVVAVIAGVVLHQLGRLPGQTAGSKPRSTTVVLVPALQGLNCIHDVAWSPDGSQLAVIGYRDLCPNDEPTNYNYQAGVLHIYSAASGKLLQTILPDPTVLALSGIPLPSPNVQPATSVSDTSKPVIDYTHVLWSPDGKRLALTFDINQWATFGAAPGGAPFLTYSGLVLMNADGTSERAALWKETSQQQVVSFNAHTALRWDTGTMSVLPLPQQLHSDDLTSLLPAQSYSWSAAGQLVPGSPLDTSPVQITRVGNPDGGSSFTIWQAGYITFLIPAAQSTSPVGSTTGVYAWTTDLPIASSPGFLTWSPDGRYLIDSVSLFMTQRPVGRPNPTTSILQQMSLPGAPNGPIRDRALQRVFLSLATVQSNGFLPTDYVDWSPNGQLLAAVDEFGLPGSSGGAPIVPSVSVYSCATGQLLATLKPEVNARISLQQLTANAYLGSTTLLRWSPDGSHVLVFSSLLDTITIFGAGQLPGGA
jgi:hypothetical protein